MPTAPPRGIRKSSELIFQKGRTLIFNEEEASEILWSDIPNGSLKINPVTGLISVKIEGESNWVPAGIKNDGTISIAKDTKLVTEIYTITNADEGDGHFCCTNKAGQNRHFPLTDEGYPIFYLEEGSYQMLRNQISLMIDDCLYRSVASGDLTELSETRIQLNEQLKAGQKVTITYSNVIRIGNPYPRIFINDNEPDVAEVGDFWIDCNDNIGDDPNYEEDPYYDRHVDWSNVDGKPTTLAGYGIRDDIAAKVHKHSINDITDFPLTMRANGGNADTVGNKSVGTGIGNIPIIGSDGKLDQNIVPIIPSKKLTIVQPDGTSNTYDGSVNTTITLKAQDNGSVFNARGELVFPNGNRFWLQ